MLGGLHTEHARDITICHHLRLSQQATSYMGFLELNKCFQAVMFWVRRNFWCSDMHEIGILFPLQLMPV